MKLLRNREELLVHLTSDGTCKCGLRCPFQLEDQFSFDPLVLSLPDNGVPPSGIQAACKVGHTLQTLDPPKPTRDVVADVGGGRYREGSTRSQRRRRNSRRRQSGKRMPESENSTVSVITLATKTVSSLCGDIPDRLLKTPERCSVVKKPDAIRERSPRNVDSPVKPPLDVTQMSVRGLLTQLPASPSHSPQRGRQQVADGQKLSEEKPRTPTVALRLFQTQKELPKGSEKKSPTLSAVLSGCRELVQRGRQGDGGGGGVKEDDGKLTVSIKLNKQMQSKVSEPLPSTNLAEKLESKPPPSEPGNGGMKISDSESQTGQTSLTAMGPPNDSSSSIVQSPLSQSNHTSLSNISPSTLAPAQFPTPQTLTSSAQALLSSVQVGSSQTSFEPVIPPYPSCEEQGSSSFQNASTAATPLSKSLNHETDQTLSLQTESMTLSSHHEATAVGHGISSSQGEGVGEATAVGHGISSSQGEGVGEATSVGHGVSSSHGEGIGEATAVGHGVSSSQGEGVREATAVGHGISSSQGEGIGEATAVGNGISSSQGEGIGEGGGMTSIEDILSELCSSVGGGSGADVGVVGSNNGSCGGMVGGGGGSNVVGGPLQLPANDVEDVSEWFQNETNASHMADLVGNALTMKQNGKDHLVNGGVVKPTIIGGEGGVALMTSAVHPPFASSLENGHHNNGLAQQTSPSPPLQPLMKLPLSSEPNVNSETDVCNGAFALGTLSKVDVSGSASDGSNSLPISKLSSLTPDSNLGVVDSLLPPAGPLRNLSLSAPVPSLVKPGLSPQFGMKECRIELKPICRQWTPRKRHFSDCDTVNRERGLQHAGPLEGDLRECPELNLQPKKLKFCVNDEIPQSEADPFHDARPIDQLKTVIPEIVLPVPLDPEIDHPQFSSEGNQLQNHSKVEQSSATPCYQSEGCSNNDDLHEISPPQKHGDDRVGVGSDAITAGKGSLAVQLIGQTCEVVTAVEDNVPIRNLSPPHDGGCDNEIQNGILVPSTSITPPQNEVLEEPFPIENPSPPAAVTPPVCASIVEEASGDTEGRTGDRPSNRNTQLTVEDDVNAGGEVGEEESGEGELVRRREGEGGGVEGGKKGTLATRDEFGWLHMLAQVAIEASPKVEENSDLSGEGDSKDDVSPNKAEMQVVEDKEKADGVATGRVGGKKPGTEGPGEHSTQIVEPHRRPWRVSRQSRDAPSKRRIGMKEIGGGGGGRRLRVWGRTVGRKQPAATKASIKAKSIGTADDLLVPGTEKRGEMKVTETKRSGLRTPTLEATNENTEKKQFVIESGNVPPNQQHTTADGTSVATDSVPPRDTGQRSRNAGDTEYSCAEKEPRGGRRRGMGCEKGWRCTSGEMSSEGKGQQFLLEAEVDSALGGLDPEPSGMEWRQEKIRNCSETGDTGGSTNVSLPESMVSEPSPSRDSPLCAPALSASPMASSGMSTMTSPARPTIPTKHDSFLAQSDVAEPSLSRLSKTTSSMTVSVPLHLVKVVHHHSLHCYSASQFRAGDVVWAKAAQLPGWPGVIINHTEWKKDRLKQAPLGKVCANSLPLYSGTSIRFEP